MLRWLAIAALVTVGCKKKAEETAEPEPAGSGSSKARGYSVTKVDDEEPAAGGGAEAPKPAAGSGSAEEPDPNKGKNAPPYRDEANVPHGPGGPVNMGKGANCTDKLDHCLRESVWFAVGNVQAGKLYRAVPAFEFEGKWWNWRGKEAEYSELFKTKVAESSSELSAGSPVIWLIEENSAPKWLSTEHDALTTSRWEVGIIDSISSDSIKVLGWDYPIPLDTVRVIVEKKAG